MKALLVVPVLLAMFAIPESESATLPRGEHDWVVDTGHSAVMFKIKHANAANFYAGFEVVEGSVTLDPASPGTGKVKLVIPIESIHTRDAKRDEHLKGPDFFNGKENPEITFVSTKIAKADDGVYDVTGDLEMAGEKRPVTMKVQKVGEGNFRGPRIGYETSFTIQRSKFGMNYGIAQNVLGDEITILASLELIKP